MLADVFLDFGWPSYVVFFIWDMPCLLNKIAVYLTWYSISGLCRKVALISSNWIPSSYSDNKDSPVFGRWKFEWWVRHWTYWCMTMMSCVLLPQASADRFKCFGSFTLKQQLIVKHNLCKLRLKCLSNAYMNCRFQSLSLEAFRCIAVLGRGHFGKVSKLLVHYCTTDFVLSL